MSRPVLIGVELVQVTDEHGTRTVPDLGAGVRERATQTAPRTYFVEKGEHAVTFYDLGTFAGQRWFIGCATRRILVGLAHLGANVKLPADLTPTQRDAILAKGLRPVRRVSDDAIVGIAPPVVLAGRDPIAVALDGQFEEGEEYYIP